MKTQKTKARTPAKAAKKSGLKTTPTPLDVNAFIDKVGNETRWRDAKTLLAMMKRITGERPVMWGPSIVGFGRHHYTYESGREGAMPITGFSPRSAASVVYVMGGVPATDELYGRLGKHRLGKSCLYINKLADIDLKILEKIIIKTVSYMRKKYGR